MNRKTVKYITKCRKKCDNIYCIIVIALRYLLVLFWIFFRKYNFESNRKENSCLNRNFFHTKIKISD